jgi:hypothetical protein
MSGKGHVEALLRAHKPEAGILAMSGAQFSDRQRENGLKHAITFEGKFVLRDQGQVPGRKTLEKLLVFGVAGPIVPKLRTSEVWEGEVIIHGELYRGLPKGAKPEEALALGPASCATIGKTLLRSQIRGDGKAVTVIATIAVAPIMDDAAIRGLPIAPGEPGECELRGAITFLPVRKFKITDDWRSVDQVLCSDMLQNPAKYGSEKRL